MEVEGGWDVVVGGRLDEGDLGQGTGEGGGFSRVLVANQVAIGES